MDRPMRVGWSDLLGYWRGLAGGEPPARSRFDPVVGLPRAVAYLTLYAVESQGFRLRIVGSEAGRQIQGRVAGRLLDEVELAPPIRDAIRSALRQSIAHRQPVLMHHVAQYDEPVRWTTLYLPLTDACGEVGSVVAGSFEVAGEPAGLLRSFRADEDAASLRAAIAPVP
jgi:hypothetical protein